MVDFDLKYYEEGDLLMKKFEAKELKKREMKEKRERKKYEKLKKKFDGN